MKKILVDLEKKEKIINIDLDWLNKTNKKINKKKKIVLSNYEYDSIIKNKNFFNLKNIEFIFKNKFGYLNFIFEKKKEKYDLKFFDNIDIYKTKWYVYKDVKFKNEIFFIKNIDNINSLIEKILEYRMQKEIYYSNISNNPLKYLKKWSKIFNIATKKEQTIFNKLDYYDYDVSKFAKLKFKDNFVWKKYEIYKSPDINNKTIKVSQENIIQSLYKNAINAIENKNYKNHFITAPTGAGKSLMFQSLAYLLSENYKRITIVVSPLIALMNDQVNEMKKIYSKVGAIHSDLSYIDKINVIEKIEKNKISIIYVSPETLLANNYEKLFASRKMGALIIDEAHIVTTWGKGFRPDYWYLDSWIKREREKNKFLIATFTATASYHITNNDAMNNETKTNLLMNDTIEIIAPAYRKDINFQIFSDIKKQMQKIEYQDYKFKKIFNFIKDNINEKILIYFPYKTQLKYCYQFLKKNNIKTLMYEGDMEKYDKKESFEKYKNGTIKIMLATKAFGMGIDIIDIKYVIHYALTGTLSDYLQEVGRAARKTKINGFGISFPVKSNKSPSTDEFTFIKTLYGMSSIKIFELIYIIKAIIYKYEKENKRNLIMSFESLSTNTFISTKNNSDIETRLKTCFIMLQRDLSNKSGFPPLIIRPSGIFTKAFVYRKNNKKDEYNNYLKKYKFFNSIYKIDLEGIWKKYFDEISFPKFKFIFYSDKKILEHLKTKNKLKEKEYLNFKKLKNNYYPRQIIKINESKNLLIKIEEAYNFAQKILDELLKNRNNEKQIKQKNIQSVAKKLSISKYVIEEFLLNLLHYDKFIRQNNVDMIIKTKEINLISNNKWKIENSIFSFIRKIYLNLKEHLEISNRINKNIFIFPMSFSKNSSYKKTIKQIKLFESTNKFNTEIIMGENLKASIRVNSIYVLKQILENNYKEGNQYINSSKKKHENSIKVLNEFFFSKMNQNELKKFIEKHFLMNLKKDKKEEF